MKRQVFKVSIHGDVVYSTTDFIDAVSWAEAFMANHKWATRASITEVIDTWHSVMVWASVK